MIYFCADDYGISKEYNQCIEECARCGALNKVSVLPNGDLSNLREGFLHSSVNLALHLNLVEGYPMSSREDLSLILSENGQFKYSFIGLFLLSLSPKRKQLEEEIYSEIRSQLRFWKELIGDGKKIFIDSHQHVCMIPLVFNTLIRVIRDEGIGVDYLRIPREPILPYLLTPYLYPAYTITGMIKQMLLRILSRINRRKFRRTKVRSAYFMGVMLSGKLNKTRVQKLLVHYSKLSAKHGRDIEIGFHPGRSKSADHLIDGSREDFNKFYSSPWRDIEYETLMSEELQKMIKEGK